jgi:hypothetical protein
MINERNKLSPFSGSYLNFPAENIHDGIIFVFFVSKI